MNKKAFWIKFAQVLITAVPPVVALVLMFPDFLYVKKAISAAAFVVIIVLLCIFKDALKRIVSLPSGFGFCLIVFVFSLISLNIGEQLLIMSGICMVSGLLGMPFDMWHKHVTRPPTKDETYEMLKEMTQKDEKSDKND